MKIINIKNRMYQFPEVIESIIFDYCYGSINGEFNGFDQVSCIFIAKLFGMKDINIEIEEYEPKYNIDFNKSKCLRIFKDKLIKKSEIKKHPDLLELTKPDDDMINKYQKIIKNAKNVSVKLSDDFEILNRFEKLYQLLIVKSLNFEYREFPKIPDKLEMQCFKSVITISIEDFENLCKIKSLKELNVEFKKNFNNETREYIKSTFDLPIAEMLPKSVRCLSVSGLLGPSYNKFAKNKKPIFHGLDLDMMKIFGDLDDENKLPENLKSLEIGEFKEFKNLNYCKNLKYLKINLYHYEYQFSITEGGKFINYIPNVENLVMDFSEFWHYPKKSDRGIIIPGSVVNLAFINLRSFSFKKNRIFLDDIENLRTLFVQVGTHEIEHKHRNRYSKIKKILEYGKLESLILKFDLKGDDDCESCIEFFSMKLKIPRSLKILVSDIHLELTGDLSGIIYMKIGI